MISASMFSSLKNPLACAVATFKLGMFGFDAAMRTRSNAKAGCDSSTAVTNTTRVFIVLSRRVLHQRHRLIFPVRPRARKHLRSRAWSTHREFDHADLVAASVIQCLLETVQSRRVVDENFFPCGLVRCGCRKHIDEIGVVGS